MTILRTKYETSSGIKMIKSNKKIATVDTYVPKAAVKSQKSRKSTMTTSKARSSEILAQSIPIIYQESVSSNIDLNDCGFIPKWRYQCSPDITVRLCVENDSNGGWIPYSIFKNELYKECEAIRNNPKRKEFNASYNSDF